MPHRARALEVIKLPENSTPEAQRRVGFQPSVIEGSKSKAFELDIPPTHMINANTVSVPMMSSLTSGWSERQSGRRGTSQRAAKALVAVMLNRSTVMLSEMDVRTSRKESNPFRRTGKSRSPAAVSVIGCGSPVVDPGRSVNRLPPPIQQPASPSGLPTLKAPEVQQVPAESVFNLPNESKSATYHTVQAGETLTNIAKRYGVSADKLRSANGLDASAKLQSQQLLYIPK